MKATRIRALIRRHGGSLRAAFDAWLADEAYRAERFEAVDAREWAARYDAQQAAQS